MTSLVTFSPGSHLPATWTQMVSQRVTSVHLATRAETVNSKSLTSRSVSNPCEGISGPPKIQIRLWCAYLFKNQ